jgi:methylglutaconyl-CoA hydratase
MAEPIVLTEVDGRGVATVTLNRPEVHNAFNEQVINRLSEIFGELAARRGLRAVVLAARGKSFCAGADLKWMTKMAGYSFEENLEDARRMAAMFDRLNTMPVPTVAKVQGSAFAGALGLISACDIAVAADHAKFAVTEVRIGLIAAAISPYVIAAIGPGAARRYFQTAERFDAAEAKRLGLLHEVVSAGALDEAVEDIVCEILRNAPESLAACKALIRDAAVPVTAELRDETATRIAHLRSEPEAREGIAAFFEKRKPAWVTAAGGDGNG